MKMLTREECETWCSGDGVETAHRRPRFGSDSPPHSFVIKHPAKGYGIVSLTVALFNDDLDHLSFSGGLFWIHEWGIGSEDTEAIGKRTMDLLRDAYVEPADFSLRPGVLFEKDELLTFRAFMVTSLIYGWDVSFIDANRNFIFFGSHDEVVYLLYRSRDDKDRMYAAYSETWEAADNECPRYAQGQ